MSLKVCQMPKHSLGVYNTMRKDFTTQETYCDDNNFIQHLGNYKATVELPQSRYKVIYQEYPLARM